MTTPVVDLLPINTPLMFADATPVFDGLATTYHRHQQGFFIMAPSGAGKTHFVKHQAKPDWLDGDLLWCLTQAQPEGEWWLESRAICDEIDQRCDVITVQAKRQGFWVVGSSNNWLRPDAVVIPHWSTHKRYIAAREQGDYDGGATTAQLDIVLSHRRWINKWARAGVPKFDSVAAAAAHLAATAPEAPDTAHHPAAS